MPKLSLNQVVLIGGAVIVAILIVVFGFYNEERNSQMDNDIQTSREEKVVCVEFRDTEDGQECLETVRIVTAGDSEKILNISDEVSVLCDEFRNIEADRTCQEAIRIALASYPGKILGISMTSVKMPDPSTSPPTWKDSRAWSINLDLEDPYVKPSGDRVTSIQVNIGMDENAGTAIKFLENI